MASKLKNRLNFAFTGAITTFSGLFGATQYSAWKLGFQPALGEPLVKSPIFPLYEPWAFLEWLKWYDTVPAIHDGLWAGAIAAAVPVGLAIKEYTERKKKDFGAKEWGRKRDAEKAGILSKTPNGTCLGLWADGKTLLSYNGDQHQLIAGATGSGKTRGPIIASILTWPGSLLVIDPKTELYSYTAKWRQRLGEAFYFDPLCPHSACFNPLEEIPVNTPYEIGAVQNLADVLMECSGLKNDSNPFWPISAKELITGLILFCLHDFDPEQRNLSVVRAMIMDIENVYEMMVKSRHPEAQRVGNSLRQSNERTRSDIAATAKAAFTLWADPMVAEKTSRSDFKLSDIVCSKYPMSFYLQVRASEAERLRPLQRIILTMMTRAMMYDPKTMMDGRKKLHRLGFILEEFPALGKMQSFQSDIRQFRGYGMTTVICCQSIRDLQAVYGDKETILENTHIQVYYATADTRTLRDITAALGTGTEMKTSETTQGGLLDGKKSRTTAENRRSLMDTGEFRQLGTDEQIVLVTGYRPFRTKKLRWDKHPVLSSRGTNLFAGEPEPAQNTNILHFQKAALALRRQAVAISEPESVDAPEQSPKAGGAPVFDVQAFIASINIPQRRLARLLFPNVAESTSRKWLSGRSKFPQDALQFMNDLAEHLEPIIDDDEAVKKFLTPKNIAKIRNAEPTEVVA